MKKMTVMVAGLLAAGTLAFAAGKKLDIVKSAAEAVFTPVPGIAGVSKSDLWGDPKKRHGGLTKFAAGLSTPRHTHSQDVTVIVIAGTLVHTSADGKAVNLGPGSYIFTPANVPHITACAAGAECEFYEEQPGEFDLKPVEAAKK